MALKQFQLIAVVNPVSGVFRVVLEHDPAPKEAEAAPDAQWHEVEYESVRDAAREDELDLWDDQFSLKDELLENFRDHAAENIEKEHSVERLLTLGSEVGVGTPDEIARHTVGVERVPTEHQV